MYFDEMIRKRNENERFSEMESNGRDNRENQENTLNSLEEQVDFMKEFLESDLRSDEAHLPFRERRAEALSRCW